MKRNISIKLPSEIVAKIDGETCPKISRSAFIERVLREYFMARDFKRTQARDLKRINAAADRLNAEAEDVLTYQASRSL